MYLVAFLRRVRTRECSAQKNGSELQIIQLILNKSIHTRVFPSPKPLDDSAGVPAVGGFHVYSNGMKRTSN